jgi:hypothetical protein
MKGAWGIVLAAVMAGAGGSRGQEVSRPEGAEALSAALREAGSASEKLRVLLRAIDDPDRSAAKVAILSRRLGAADGKPEDLFLAIAAVRVLAEFRGNAAAARALLAAHALHRKHPWLAERILDALARVGHESAWPTFEEIVRGGTSEAAVRAVRRAAWFPPAQAVEWLLNQGDFLEEQKRKGDEQRDRATPVIEEVVEVLGRLTGEPYKTFPEFQIWWRKRGEEFRRRVGGTSTAGMAVDRGSGWGERPPGRLPPVLLVDLRFSAIEGRRTSNGGVTEATARWGLLDKSAGRWTDRHAPDGAPGALEEGVVDLGGAGAFLAGLQSFTLTGWIRAWRPEPSGAGGGKSPGAEEGWRILSWLAPRADGVELCLRPDGSLQLGINESASESPVRTPAGRIPILASRDAGSEEQRNAAWRFFAVTYEAVTGTGRAVLYVGTPGQPALVQVELPYPRGPVGRRIAPVLSVGHLGPPWRAARPSEKFPGHIDEIRIYGSPLEDGGVLGPTEIEWVKKGLLR